MSKGILLNPPEPPHSNSIEEEELELIKDRALEILETVKAGDDQLPILWEFVHEIAIGAYNNV